MKTCLQDVFNISVILNPALGQLNDGGRDYRQWQQQMRSFRRGKYEQNVDRNSNPTPTVTKTVLAPTPQQQPGRQQQQQ